ncbi:MAG: LuxR family transcriptional regulator [Rhodomicrobium sp.]
MSAGSIECGAFDFIDGLAAAAAESEVYGLLWPKLAAFGFSNFAIADMPPPSSKLDTHVILNGWSKSWYAHYMSQNLYPIDPVARRLRESVLPFFWHEMDLTGDDSTDARRVMDEASEFGLKYGFSVPIHGANGSQACVTMGGERISVPPRGREAIHLMAIYAHSHASALRAEWQKHRVPAPRPSLTKREREVLRWVAAGKSDWEIGEILGISEDTAFAHVRNSTRKLRAMTRTHAVALALLAGEIAI